MIRRSPLANLLAMSAMCTLLSEPVLAQQQQTAAYFEFDTTVPLSAAEHMTLARVGEPIRADASLEGLRSNPTAELERVVREACGENRLGAAQPNLYSRALELNRQLLARIENTGRSVTTTTALREALASQGVPLRDETADAAVPIDIPFCISPGDAVIDIAAGETIDRILKRVYPGDEPPTHYEAIYAANTVFLEGRRRETQSCATISGPREIVACLNGFLRQGDRVQLPAQRRSVSVGVDQAEIGMLLHRFRALTLEARSDGVRFVDAVAPPTGAPNCSARPSGGAFPFDSADIWRRYTEERGRAPSPRASVIGIIDAGVQGPEPQLPEVLFTHKAGAGPELHGTGISNHGYIRPYRNDPARSHGTQVADLATGGSAFRSGVSASGAASPIELRVYSLATGQRRHSIGPTDALYGVNYLLRADREYREVRAQVVNLSLEQSDGEPDWDRTLIDDSTVLFVAAAGNDQRYLETDNRVFPAAFGGAGRSNLLTVAALDRAGALAPFSNYGADIVDIAAPGCEIRVMDETFAARDRWGTSFAAPQVSFAAALVSSLSPQRPTAAALKQRIIYAADFQPALTSDVRLGATLNVARAIAVNSDVLTTGANVDTGVLTATSALARICREQTITNVRRLIGVRTGPSEYRVDRYFVASNGAVRTRRCARATIASGSLVFRPHSGSAPIDLATLERFDLLLNDTRA